jgi:enoyl-CoA hydratase/carnithine racemase
VHAAGDQTLEQALTSAEGEMLEALKSQDFREGVSSWMEKRAAQFTGR